MSHKGPPFWPTPKKLLEHGSILFQKYLYSAAEPFEQEKLKVRPQ